MFYDPDTRELLRTRSNPMTPEEVSCAACGPRDPQAVTEPVRVQRRASKTGVVMVCGQMVAIGRAHQHQMACGHP